MPQISQGFSPSPGMNVGCPSQSRAAVRTETTKPCQCSRLGLPWSPTLYRKGFSGVFWVLLPCQGLRLYPSADIPAGGPSRPAYPHTGAACAAPLPAPTRSPPEVGGPLWVTQTPLLPPLSPEGLSWCAALSRARLRPPDSSHPWPGGLPPASTPAQTLTPSAPSVPRGSPPTLSLVP